jgi:ubiquitin-like-conjugating enzyme ATG3
MAARFLHGVAEYFMPVLKESAFTEKGILTPEEFVEAGDNLVFKCPTWEWYVAGWPCWRGIPTVTFAAGFCSVFSGRSAGDPTCAKPYLPPDKQFLITRGGAFAAAS